MNPPSLIERLQQFSRSKNRFGDNNNSVLNNNTIHNSLATRPTLSSSRFIDSSNDDEAIEDNRLEEDQAEFETVLDTSDVQDFETGNRRQQRPRRTGSAATRAAQQLTITVNNNPNNGTGNDLMPPVPPAPQVVQAIKYSTHPLPKRLDRQQKRIQEDQEANIGQNGYVCQLCKLNYGLSQASSTQIILSNISRLEEQKYQRGQRGDHDERYRRVANDFNTLIYAEYTEEEKEQDGLTPWTMEMVRYHYEHCDKSRAERRLDKLIDMIDDMIEYQDEHLETREELDGVVVNRKLNLTAVATVTKLALTYQRLLESREKISGQAVMEEFLRKNAQTSSTTPSGFGKKRGRNVVNESIFGDEREQKRQRSKTALGASVF